MLCSDIDLPEAEHKQLEDLVLEFADIFTLNDAELGCTDKVVHTILQFVNQLDAFHFHSELK